MIEVIFPTLYGISSKGVVKVWTIKVIADSQHSDAVDIATTHGQFNGKLQVATETIREGKNTGKANATTPYEQAQLEAQSKWKKKHDSNYTEVYPDINYKKEPEFKLLPMLAQKYKERAKYLVWPAFIQTKLNGVRCLVQRKGDKIIFWSRKAKKYKNFNLYMEQDFLSFMKDGEVLDGEMYNHGDITFQELMSLIKDEKNPEIDKLKKYVKFWCYDAPTVEGGFKKRLEYITTKMPRLDYVVVTETHIVENPTDVKEWHGLFTQQGYEGSIIRSGGDEPYTFQYRDNQLQKNKDFMDAEFEIVGCKEGTGSYEGVAVFHCQSDSKTGGRYGDGTFDVVCKGTRKQQREQWTNWKSYLGKELTVRYQTFSDEGIPIFPVGIIVRDYE